MSSRTRAKEFAFSSGVESTDCSQVIQLCGQVTERLQWNGRSVRRRGVAVVLLRDGRRRSIVNPPGPTGHCVRPSWFIRAQMFPTSYNSPRYIATFPRSFLEDRVERCIRSSYHFDRLCLKQITLLYLCLFLYADTLLLLRMLYHLFFLSSSYSTFRLQKCRFHVWLCYLAYKISHQPFKEINAKINWIERMTLAMKIIIKAGRGCNCSLGQSAI